MLTKHFRLLLVKAAASFFGDSVTRLLSNGPVFRTISIVKTFIEKRKYSQLPLLRTPSGLRVSVLNRESPVVMAGIYFSQTSVIYFLPGI